MELEILRGIQSIANPFFDFIFQLFTVFGEELIIIPFLTIIYWGYDKKLGEYVGFSVFTSLLLNNSMKDIFKFKRPIGEEGIRSLRVNTATGYSFPSGHSQGAAAFYGSVALYLRKKFIYIISFAVMFLVGFSRLYLGVHYPKDVLVGLVIGFFIACISLKLFNSVKNRNILYIIVFLIFIPFVFFEGSRDLIKSFGSYAGFILGIFIEKKYINFSNKTNIMSRIIRILIGLIIVFALKIGLKMIFPDKSFFDFLRYFIMVLFGIGIYPIAFKKIDFSERNK